MIELLCPGCRTKLSLTEDRAGSTFECPRCKQAISVPFPVAPATAPEAPPAPRSGPPPVPRSRREEDDYDDRRDRRDDDDRRDRRRRDEDDYDDAPRRRSGPPPVPRSSRRDEDDDGESRPRRKRGSCPYCGSKAMPITKQRVSTAGWIVFGILLVCTIVLFWIGLLMKEDYQVCPECRAEQPKIA